MATFRVLNFGCRASQADGAALKAQLLNAGFAEAESAAPSDLVVLNTCTVTAAADAEIRQTIRRIHRENSETRVLVTGCYAQRAPGEIASLEGVCWVVGNSHKHLIPEILKAEGTGNREQGIEYREQGIGNREQGGSAATSWVGEISPRFHFLPASADDRTRPTLKVQDGCNARCSFCIIPTVRGRSRSLPPEEAIAQIRKLEQEGYREVVISGINLGGYGSDLSPRISLLDLLQRIMEETSIQRLRISSIEPMDVRPELIGLISRQLRFARHFHVPLQSGCDRILRQMNRRYWTAHYAERIHAIREAMPNCAVGADIMAGFPGETDHDHSESAAFIDSLPFTYLHVFPYSARASTPAAGRPDQVDGRVLHQRAAELRAIGARKHRRFMENQVGRSLSVLTLGESGSEGVTALSSNYLKVILPGAPLRSNELITVRIGRASLGRLFGHLERQAETVG